MKSTILTIISGLWILGAVYLLYTFGVGLSTWHWKQFFITLAVMVALSVAGIIVATTVKGKL